MALRPGNTAWRCGAQGDESAETCGCPTHPALSALAPRRRVGGDWRLGTPILFVRIVLGFQLAQTPTSERLWLGYFELRRFGTVRRLLTIALRRGDFGP